MRPRSLVVLVLSGLTALVGCTSHDLVTHAARPGKFETLNCDQLNKRGRELVVRERELQDLMTRAAQGPGGEIAIALAYKTDFTMVQGDLREVDISGANKHCQMKHRTISEQIVR